MSPFNEIKKNRVEIGDIIKMVAYTKIESWFQKKMNGAVEKMCEIKFQMHDRTV